MIILHLNVPQTFPLKGETNLICQHSHLLYWSTHLVTRTHDSLSGLSLQAGYMLLGTQSEADDIEQGGAKLHLRLMGFVV